MNKKEAAWLLYESGKQQKEIASVLGITENTVSAWQRKHKWQEKRTQKTLMQESVREDVYELIQYQVRALKLKKRAWEEDLKSFEAGNGDAKDIKLLERGDIDALQKLFTTVKGKVATWSDYVEIINDFMQYLEENNFTLAKSLVDHAKQFLNHKREIL